jgi:hypothetical protein
MAWLDALLAFAITMMVLSTIVSAVVEAGHGLLNQRVKGLERLMEHMFDKVIAPRLAGHMPADLTGSRFVKQMTDLRWVPVETNASSLKKYWYGIVRKFRRTDKAQELTTLEFLERLAESPVGASVLERSVKLKDNDKTLGVFLEDLASKFEDFGEDASRYFARRARVFSVFVGFVLVFAINFSAIDVVKTLMQSESARTALIEQGDAIAAGLNRQLAAEAEARRKVLEDDPDANPVAVEEIEQKLQRSVNEGVRTLQQSQLLVGWQHAPWLAEKLPKGQSIGAWSRFWQWICRTPGEFARWLGSVFLGGLLVGLGGPFWFDTYRRLAAMSSVAKVFQSEVKQESQAQEAPAGGEQATRFVRIFNVARQAANFAQPAGRQPLTNDGNAIQLGHVR